MGLNKEIKGVWRGKINPILATLGSLIILVGGCINPLFSLYLAICLTILVVAYLYTAKNAN